MRLTCWRNLTDTAGQECDWTWSRLAEWFANPIAFRGPETPGWSAAAFIGPQRRLDRCMAVSALVLDFDDGKAPKNAIEGMFGNNLALAHTSKSHTAENPSYRVVVALSRPVLPAEYSLVWQAVTRPFVDTVDQAAKDCSRFWFVPCRTEATEYESFGFDGAPLDVDAILAQERERIEKASRATAPRKREYSNGSGRMSVEERASRYVSRMDPSVSGSHGHDKLWAATVALVRGFELSRDEAHAILWNEFNPRCLPPWSQKEIAHKLDEASRSKLDAGYLLGESPGYEYRAEPPVIPPCPKPPPEPMSLNDPDGVAVDVQEHVSPQEPEQPQSAFDRLGIVSIQTLCLNVLTDVNKPKDKSSCKTGISELDIAMGGLRPGMVAVLGAPTSFGKTTFSIMVADLAAKADKLVIYVSLEDSALLYGRRIVARRGGINALRLRDGEISQDDRRKIMRVVQGAQKEPFFLDGIGKSAEWIARALVDVSRERKIDLVVLDYIQRMRTERRTENRRTEVTAATEAITNTIKSIGAAGLVLSQLRRLEDDERPTRSDLKESGDIENMAEHIILGYTKRNGDEQERKVFLDKNKDGPLFAHDIDMRFNDASASFLASDEIEGADPIDLDDLDAQFPDAF